MFRNTENIAKLKQIILKFQKRLLSIMLEYIQVAPIDSITEGQS